MVFGGIFGGISAEGKSKIPPELAEIRMNKGIARFAGRFQIPPNPQKPAWIEGVAKAPVGILAPTVTRESG